jgi:hypothetical protein
MACGNPAHEFAAFWQTQTWTLSAVDGNTREIRLALRQFFPQELRALLERQGFVVESVGDGFEDGSADQAGLKQVIKARLIKNA